METDFSKVLIHASSMGCLFTEPRDAAAKKAGELSATAKSHLIKVYIETYWGRKKDFATKQMEKGTFVEEDLITLLSRIDKRLYSKNEEKKSNEWATGHADIVETDEIIDVKGSYEAETFLPKIVETIDKGYDVQLQTYMWLYDKPKARLCYGLVNTPDFLIQNELRSLLFKLNVATEEAPEYKIAAMNLIRNMIFDDIPIEERLISIPVARNEEIIQQMPGKVKKAREFLQYFHEKHINLNKNAFV